MVATTYNMQILNKFINVKGNCDASDVRESAAISRVFMRYCLYQLPEIPFNWHYHPEYEICLTLNSVGVCHVGDHIAPYEDLDLVILGPDLPHTWQSKPNLDHSAHVVHVAQIPAPWLESLVAQHPELHGLSELLNAARRGVKFPVEVAKQAKIWFEQIANSKC